MQTRTVPAKPGVGAGVRALHRTPPPRPATEAMLFFFEFTRKVLTCVMRVICGGMNVRKSGIQLRGANSAEPDSEFCTSSWSVHARARGIGSCALQPVMASTARVVEGMSSR